MGPPTVWEVVVRMGAQVVNRHTHKTSQGALQCQRHLMNAFGPSFIVEAAPLGVHDARRAREKARERRTDRRALLDKA